MLNKLLKYELKATARTFLPMYGLLLLFSIGTRIAMAFTHTGQQSNNVLEFIAGLFLFGYVVLITLIFVMTVVISIQRFYKNLLGDEGYLSFTLPVTTGRHIWSKLIVSCMWVVASCVLLIVSLMVMLADGSMFSHLPRFFPTIAEITVEFGGSFWWMLLNCFFLMVVALVQTILGIYCAIAVGSLVPKHRVLVGVGAYAAGGILQSIIFGFSVNFVGRYFLESSAMQVFFEDHIFSTNQVIAGMQGISMVFGCLSLFFLFFCVVYFILTHWILKNRLNLQ